MNTDPCYYRISIKGLVRDGGGKIMLVLQDDGYWELPGGGLEHNEDPKDCLAREIMEEAGLAVTSVAQIPRYFITVQRFGHDTFIANVIYEVTLANLDFTPSQECQELRFVDLTEMDKLNLFPTTRKFYDVLLEERTS
jgi:8-oxo-dGTP pyrophosphatase MutT (NUDIX family)